MRMILCAFLWSAGSITLPTLHAQEKPNIGGQLKSLDIAIQYCKTMQERVQDYNSSDTIKPPKFWIWNATGFDTTKPIAWYGTLTPKRHFSNFIFIVPILKQEDALEGLKELGFTHEKKSDSLYRIKNPNLINDNIPTWVQFRGATAYLGINVNSEELDPKRLLAFDSVYDKTDTATLTINANIQDLPQWAIESMQDFHAMLTEFQLQLTSTKQKLDSDGFYNLYRGMLEWIAAHKQAFMRDTEAVAVHFDFDKLARQLAMEFEVTPKPDTPLAAAIQNHPIAIGKYHQLVTADAILALQCTASEIPVAFKGKVLPFFNWWALSDATIGGTLSDVLKAIIEQLKIKEQSGIIDFAAVMNQADKDGDHDLILAMELDDAKAIETLILESLAKASDDASPYQHQATMINGAVHHTFVCQDDEFPYVKLFGKKHTIRMAATTSSLVVAIGPNAEKHLKSALNLKPKPGAVMSFDLNVKPFIEVLLVFAPNQQLIQYLFPGSNHADQLKRMFGFDVKSGQSMKVRFDDISSYVVFVLYTYRMSLAPPKR